MAVKPLKDWTIEDLAEALLGARQGKLEPLDMLADAMVTDPRRLFETIARNSGIAADDIARAAGFSSVADADRQAAEARRVH